MKEKAHVGFWRRGINKTVATSTFPLTVPIILDHPVGKKIYVHLKLFYFKSDKNHMSDYPKIKYLKNQ